MFISVGGYVGALMILMLRMNNFTNDHLCGGYGGVVGVASLRGIGNPSRAANPPAKVAQISDEYLTRQKIFGAILLSNKISGNYLMQFLMNIEIR